MWGRSGRWEMLHEAVQVVLAVWLGLRTRRQGQRTLLHFALSLRWGGAIAKPGTVEELGAELRHTRTSQTPLAALGLRKGSALAYLIHDLWMR